jgi:hypothetical protein
LTAWKVAKELNMNGETLEIDCDRRSELEESRCQNGFEKSPLWANNGEKMNLLFSTGLSKEPDHLESLVIVMELASSRTTQKQNLSPLKRPVNTHYQFSLQDCNQALHRPVFARLVSEFVE